MAFHRIKSIPHQYSRPLSPISPVSYEDVHGHIICSNLTVSLLYSPLLKRFIVCANMVKYDDDKVLSCLPKSSCAVVNLQQQFHDFSSVRRHACVLVLIHVLFVSKSHILHHRNALEETHKPKTVGAFGFIFCLFHDVLFSIFCSVNSCLRRVIMK